MAQVARRWYVRAAYCHDRRTPAKCRAGAPAAIGVPLDQFGDLEERDQRSARDETANVRPERHPALGADRAYAAHQLRHEPVAQHPERRDGEGGDKESKEDEHLHAHLRIQEHVGAHDAAYGAGCPDHRDAGRRVSQDLCRSRTEAAQEVEGHEPDMAHRVLDVIAEDPEKPQVADDVQPATVQEHVADRRQPVGLVRQYTKGIRSDLKICASSQGLQQLTRYQAERAHRGGQPGLHAKALNKHPGQDIQDNQAVGGVRREEVRIFVAEGKHEFALMVAGSVYLQRRSRHLTAKYAGSPHQGYGQRS